MSLQTVPTLWANQMLSCLNRLSWIRSPWKGTSHVPTMHMQIYAYIKIYSSLIVSFHYFFLELCKHCLWFVLGFTAASSFSISPLYCIMGDQWPIALSKLNVGWIVFSCFQGEHKPFSSFEFCVISHSFINFHSLPLTPILSPYVHSPP